jgi:beta-alanine--pyruvate transaminase
MSNIVVETQKLTKNALLERCMTINNKTGGDMDISAYWLPVTPNRYFQHHPKIMQSEKGAYYYDDHGRKLFDGLSGLWCSPLGHADLAIQKQFETMDYCPAFQMASEEAFSLATRIAKMAPKGLDKVFFTNSGSEAVDTALKIAVGYHCVMGNASRTRLIG